MPRSNRRRRDEAPLDVDRVRSGVVRVEPGPDGDWVVRSVTGAGSPKSYRCPGCDHEIPAGVAHVVAWPVEGTAYGADGLDARRHWHRGCWAARTRGRRRA
jgi:hypothetical protein